MLYSVGYLHDSVEQLLRGKQVKVNEAGMRFQDTPNYWIAKSICYHKFLCQTNLQTKSVKWMKKSSISTWFMYRNFL